MANFNRIILIGRLTANPEILNTVEGNALSKFTLACDRPPRQDGAKEADFINIVTWGKLAERCAEFLSKGRLVLIEGRIQQRTYQTADGQKRWVTEVVASKMRMLDSKKTAGKDQEFSEETAFPAMPDEAKGGEFTFDEEPEAGTSEVPF